MTDAKHDHAQVYTITHKHGQWQRQKHATAALAGDIEHDTRDALSRPVMTQPILSVMLNTWVTESGSTSLSTTFFCVITTALLSPRTATDVRPGARAALNAYSAHPHRTHRRSAVSTQLHRTAAAHTGSSQHVKCCDTGALQAEQCCATHRRAILARGTKPANLPIWYSRPSGEKMVMCRSYPDPDMVTVCGATTTGANFGSQPT